ncbi:type I-F CRISPR-associated helicase Cas3f [Pelagibaculum spongiae]|uniref:Type I-F CRISPR-associated helicase Cas3 n=1 Tax=Pelagibaculum spongiae TaxID=2080658 RepID=A0A2V1H388_9GAMM|nr:type I-F CRISPR-associated helicase Cas3f [Pelagibaculum spongiae]PVZ69767.1 type I-F CRISPR-associated helicase Cas3 [Pelagibaculum spongiae]
MMVTFVSQCQKNALKKTRRVLDAFADRIGDNTWQTVITEEGLQAVRKLLRKTASKNTAVSCHRYRSRSSTELMWVVGRKDAFNLQGRVPVNTTQVNRTLRDDAEDWIYLPLIQALTALAALLHDWGKANQQFQSKLKADSGKPQGDALRHEFISCLLFRILIEQTDASSDQSWLELFANGQLLQLNRVETNTTLEKPLKDLPLMAQVISWLVLSHHRLPYQDTTAAISPTFSDLLDQMDKNWGYFNPKASQTLQACLGFEFGVLSEAKLWLKQVKRWASKLITLQAQLEQVADDGSIRLLLHHCRLSLMLADHCYSSQQVSGKWHGEKNLVANTRSYQADNKKGFYKTSEPNQYLDQHLLGVCDASKSNTRLLPMIENRSLKSSDTAKLKKRSPQDFQWQDKAVQQIKAWQKSEADYQKQGFFAVNMASTGCGKTFANAKVMRVLSNDGDSLRYILALGLRTLTLQTGDEYRQKIFSKTDGADLAVLIGSKAVKELHQSAKAESLDDVFQQTGSESAQPMLASQDQVIYDGEIPEDGLQTVLKNEKDQAFFHAPVLACTIDHLMSAVTSSRGGRYILPSLRLLSSDLVIDEIDDFTGEDSIAIGWLIHLAGMLGRKVMISSATIPPAMAEGYFKAYQAGWQMFAKMRNRSSKVGCAWIDEFKTSVESVYQPDNTELLKQYQAHHQTFINARVTKLATEIAKRKAIIIKAEKLLNLQQPEKLEGYQQTILDAAINLHQQHSWKDPASESDRSFGLNISFGVVRCANISFALSLTRFLLDCQIDSDYCLRVMPYHSQQVLLLRNAQEQHLDQVLKRKEKAGEQPQALDNSVIQQHIVTAKKQSAKQLVFILVATPVEEVGRDHDFDWAVIEPSSYRSLVQMAGRVRRHRKTATEKPNIGILQYNWKALEDGDKAKACYFKKPGYETGKTIKIGRREKPLRCNSHNLEKLLDESVIAERFDATTRIDSTDKSSGLAQLEHASIQNDLTSNHDSKPDTLDGYLTQYWFLSSICQQKIRFRRSEPGIQLYLAMSEDEEIFFIEKDDAGKPVRTEDGELSNVEKSQNIERYSLGLQQTQRLWLSRDYLLLIEQQAEKQSISRYYASVRYGELTMRDSKSQWLYNDQLGLFKDI